MANIKIGIIGIIGTAITVVMEYLLFPIALGFQSSINSTCDWNSTGKFCIDGGRQWISDSNRTILNNTSTLMIVIILMTLISGVIGSLYFAIKIK